MKLLIAIDRLNAGFTLQLESLDPAILDLPLFQVGETFDFYPICITEAEANEMAGDFHLNSPLGTPMLEVHTTSLRNLLSEDEL